MNLTAKLRRTSAVMLSCSVVMASVGCLAPTDAPPAATEEALTPAGGDSDLGASAAASETADGVSLGDTFAADSGDIVAPRLASASMASSEVTVTRPLIPQSRGLVGLELGGGDGFEQLQIQSGTGKVPHTVTRLSDPERLVIDLPNQRTAKNHSFDASGMSLISRVRVGSHPDKSRIVLDLNRGEGIEHRVVEESGKLTVTLSKAGSMPSTGQQMALNLEDDSRAAPKSDSIRERLIDTKDNSEPMTSEGELLAPREDSSIARVAFDPDEASRASTLEGLRFEKSGPSRNSVVAQVEKLGSYDLTKTSQSEYVLKIENAKAADSVQTMLVAGAEEGMIRSVRAVKEGDDLLLRIFAKPDATLSVRNRGPGTLEVTSSMSDDNTRAQLAPEKAEKTEAPPAKVEESAKVEPVADVGSSKVEVSDKDAAGGGDEFSALLDGGGNYSGRLISLDLQDTDIDNALRIIAEVSNLNIIASDDVTGKVTLRLIDVPWDQALDVILKTNGLDKVQEGNVIRIAPVEKLRQEREALKQAQQAEEQLEPLLVKYVRVSYAKAGEVKALIENVLTERGSVAYDDRSNQLIIKDVRKGVKNASELVSKVDLRTPQVLLETQIVEASRSMLRDLGAEIGFSYIESPATGNATGYNFPNAVTVGGGLGNGLGAAFPAAVSNTAGSAINFLFDSADGSKNLDLRLSALETEGRVRIVSRPSVATTNNKPAVIKSVEKIRVKLPSGGLSVATGAGASAAGSGSAATEIIEVGITLQVTPQASPDYYVLLDVDAKSSTFGTRTVEGIPSEVERSATSTILVSSGQTFAMGGIYKITDRDTISGVPFFKDIPFLGHLFRNAKVDNSDEELLFFITPRIVEGSFDDAAMKAAS